MMTARYRGFYVPYGGRWHYLVPETGRYFESKMGMYDLVGQIQRHYEVNKMPAPENLEALIEDHICMHSPVGSCLGPDPRNPADVPPTYFEVVRDMETFFRGKPRPLASVRAADLRATICVRCKENSLGFCLSCTGLRSLASRFVGNRTLPQDNFLGVCKRARMPCNALVHLVEPPGGLTPPANCWIV